MASLEIKSLENIISAKKTFTNHGWKVMWNVSDEIVYIKREISTSFLKIDKNLRMTGVHCKENIFEMSFAKLTLNNIESTLKTLETQVSQRFADGTTRNLQNGDALLQEIEANDNKKRPDNRKKSQNTRRYSTDDTMEAESDQQDLWKCDSCSKSFRFKVQLKLHQKVIHQVVTPQEKPYCCDCKRYFPTYTSLRKHEATNIHKKKIFVSNSLDCKICNRRFVAKGGQISHFKSKYHKNAVRTASKWSTKKFSSSLKIQQRRQTIDTKPGTFKCKICELKFSRYTDLYLHKKYKHNKFISSVSPLRACRKPQIIKANPSGCSTVSKKVGLGSILNEMNLQQAENTQQKVIDIVKMEPQDLDVKLENASNYPPLPVNSHHRCIVISSDSGGSTSDSDND